MLQPARDLTVTVIRLLFFADNSVRLLDLLRVMPSPFFGTDGHRRIHYGEPCL